MKIEMNVKERLTVLGLLPKEGNFLTLRLIRDLATKLGLSADEHKEFAIKVNTESNSVNWNAKGNEPKGINFKIKEIELINKALIKLDKEEKLTEVHYSIYKKFVEEDKEVEEDGNINKDK